MTGSAIQLLVNLSGMAVAGALVLALQRTVVIVSHRLRLVSAADLVVVLDSGRVVETGRPAELAERDGPYGRLLAAGGDEGDRP